MCVCVVYALSFNDIDGDMVARCCVYYATHISNDNTQCGVCGQIARESGACACVCDGMENEKITFSVC